MRTQLELFLTAVGFFTRVPVPGWVPFSVERLAHAARYLPAVGWLVGGLGALAYGLASQVLPPDVAVVLSMVATLVATGAFHEDGLADTCDGLGGGLDRDRALAIMKDSRIGSYGAIGLVLALLLKALALVNLGVDADMPVILALLAAHPLSRLAPVTLMAVLDYARTGHDAKAGAVARRLTPAELGIATLAGVLPLLLLNATEAGLALAATVIVTAWAGRLFRRRLDGYTGDCLGATQQIAELAIYLALLAAWNFT